MLIVNWQLISPILNVNELLFEQQAFDWKDEEILRLLMNSEVLKVIYHDDKCYFMLNIIHNVMQYSITFEAFRPDIYKTVHFKPKFI